MEQIIVLLIGGFLASCLQTGTGFGAAIVMMNLFPLFFAPTQSLIVCQLTCIVIALSALTRCYKSIRWDVCLPMMIPSFIFTSLGSYLSGEFEPTTMLIILGFVFIAIAFFYLFFESKIRLKPSKVTGIGDGAVSGFVNGLVGIGGPIAVLYLAPAIKERMEYLATTQVFFISTNLISLVTRIFTNQIHTSELKLFVFSGVGAIFGMLVGFMLLKKLRAELIRKFIYVFVGINGIIMIVKNLF